MAEPLQARAVAALMRAMARFSSGAAGQSGEEQESEPKADQKEGEKGEKKDAEKEEDEKKEGEEQARESEKEPSDDEKKDAKKAEPMSRKRAKRMLEEAAQQERDLRRDINKRRGTKGVEVRRDWSRGGAGALARPRAGPRLVRWQGTELRCRSVAKSRASVPFRSRRRRFFSERRTFTQRVSRSGRIPPPSKWEYR